MRTLFLGLLAGGAILGGASCQKVIDLEVGDSSPQVVVEGVITDDSLQSWTVRLSKSVAFTATNEVQPISGAKVWITDATAGRTDTLREVTPGRYTFPRVGAESHRYELTVVTPADGTFTAASTMPAKVPFDSVYIETAAIFGQKGGQVYPVYTDPAGIVNFYYFRVLIRDRVIRTEARDDRFSDGRINGQPIGFPIEDSLQSGEPVTVEMQCMDESLYRYFSTLGRSDGNSVAPANPTSNITGGALGYFGVYTVGRQQVLLP